MIYQFMIYQFSFQAWTQSFENCCGLWTSSTL